MAYIVVNRRRYELPDPKEESFTFGELADMEAVAGVPMNTLHPNSMRGLLAVIFIALQRGKADITIDQIRALTPDEIEMVKDEPEADPQTAGDEAGTDDNDASPTEDEISGAQP